MAVLDEVGGFGSVHGRGRHIAHEVGLQCPVLRRQRIGVGGVGIVEAVAGAAVVGQEVGHGVRADDLQRDVAVVSGSDRRHRELRCGIAEIVQRRVADAEHALAETACAGDRVVPCEVELGAVHTGRRERRKRRFHDRPTLLQSLARDAIAIGAEHRVGFDRVGVGVVHRAQADGVVVTLAEHDGGMDDQRAVGVVCGLHVQLGPQRDALAGRSVDDDHRRSVVQRAVEVGPRRELRRFGGDAGHVCKQRAVRAEPVTAVPLGQVHRHTLGIGSGRIDRHRDPNGRVCALVADGVSVTGKGQQARTDVQRVATDRARVEHRVDRGHGLGVRIAQLGQCGVGSRSRLVRHCRRGVGRIRHWWFGGGRVCRCRRDARRRRGVGRPLVATAPGCRHAHRNHQRNRAPTPSEPHHRFPPHDFDLDDHCATGVTRHRGVEQTYSSAGSDPHHVYRKATARHVTSPIPLHRVHLLCARHPCRVRER